MWLDIINAPQDGSEFLAYDAASESWRVVSALWFEDEKPVWWTGENRFNATHWQPLTSPKIGEAA